MLAKDNGRIKGKRNLMTNPMIAKSKRQLCKHQTFVRKPTRHRTYKLQVEAHFSPSRAVISCDFQGAICKKEKRLTLSIGSHRNESKRAIYLKFFQSFLQYPLTYTKEFRRHLSDKNAYSLQIIYDFPPTISADSEQVCTTIKTTIYELFTCVLSNELFAQ